MLLLKRVECIKSSYYLDSVNMHSKGKAAVQQFLTESLHDSITSGQGHQFNYQATTSGGVLLEGRFMIK
jgi:hypothetical protein